MKSDTIQPRVEQLKALEASVGSCTLCPRSCQRTKVLSEANGNLVSRVLFVAEAPGRLGADRTGVPLYGDKTGDNFERLLSAANWRRQDVFSTNAVLCNPRDTEGNNTTPTSAEVRNCSYYLRMTINLTRPDVVVALGSTALSALSYIAPHDVRLQSDCGRAVCWNQRLLVPLYHPGPRAMIVRPMAEQEQDFRRLAGLVHPEKGLIPDATPGLGAAVFAHLQEDRLAQMILLAVQHLGRITYFKLTKLLYLIDYRAHKDWGRTISDAVYLRQKEGPWPPQLQKLVPQLKDHELLTGFTSGMPWVAPGPSPRLRISLTRDQLELVLDVLEHYGQLDNARLKTAAYQTKPMRFALSQEHEGVSMYNKPILYKDEAVSNADQGCCHGDAGRRGEASLF